MPSMPVKKIKGWKEEVTGDLLSGDDEVDY
jgi:hypothetical protein